MARNYSNIAIDTTLSAGIGAGDLSLTVASATGWPAAPFAAVLDPGSLTVEEVVQVTAKAGTTWTITRGFDGTAAAIHALGVTVRHAAIAGDFTDLQAADATNAAAIVAEAGTRAADDTTIAGNLATHAALNTTAHGGLAAIAGAQNANLVFAGPSAGGPVLPSFRALVAADLPAGTGTVGGTGTAGRVAQWAAGGANIENSTLAKTGAGVLTLDASGAFTLTVPATGTAALLATANIFTAQQAVRIGTNTPALIVRESASHTLAAPLIRYQNNAGTFIGGIAIDANVNIIISASVNPPTPSGLANVLLGANAGVNIGAGGSNFALGDSSLNACVTGSQNVAIGSNSLIAVTQNANVGIGQNAGLNITTGSNNVCIGLQAGNGSGSGHRANNVFIGAQAGLNAAVNTTAAVVIGYQAGAAAASGELWIENSNSVRPLIKGDFSADTLTFFATDSATANPRTVLTLDYKSGNTPTAGLGVRSAIALRSTTTDSRPASADDTLWTDPTDATRTTERRLLLTKSGTLTEAQRIDFGGGVAANTGMMLFDVDNNTLERVTVGAADSGGVGFKVLRIPN